jgi:hypothetical protein
VISKTIQFLYTFADMIRHLLVSGIINLLASTMLFSQNLVVKKDLQVYWQTYDESKATFVRADENTQRTIYFALNPSEERGTTLLVSSHRPYVILLNGKLVRRADHPVAMSVDSLASVFGYRQLQVGVHREVAADALKTLLLERSPMLAGQSEAKPPTYFRDFVILSGLILTVFFVVMMRVQPKLAADYFSPSRILTFREAEDTPGHARFALSSNVWYYVFSSMLVALLLMITYRHLPDDFVFSNKLVAQSFGSAVTVWLWLSTAILLLLAGKILIIFSLSNLFGMRGIAGLHFFNVIRLLLIAGGALSLIVFLYFLWRGNDPGVYQTILSIFMILSGGWILLTFLKLSNRTEHSMFHLFSYICATEVIPLLITVKVLFQ